MTEVCYTWRRGHVRVTLRCREGETAEALKLVRIIDRWDEGEARAMWAMAGELKGLFGDWLEDRGIDRKHAWWVCFCKSYPIKSTGGVVGNRRTTTHQLFEDVIHSTTTQLNRLVGFLAEPLPVAGVQSNLDP